MLQEDDIIPVILSGGTGTRLWPVSRESHPKPFIHLPDGQSLLQKTFLRAVSFTNAVEILTITNKGYYLKTIAEYEKISLKQGKKSFLLEPFALNTAPAILLAALKILASYGPQAILLILPADHLINETDTFNYFCQKAFKLAKQNKLVTFGIVPKTPETGFGYLEMGDALPDECYQVKHFIEKPTADLAKAYLQSGSYLWNAGMFCFKIETLLNEFAIHAPQLLTHAQECWQLSQKDSSIAEINAEYFAKLNAISIDYALMEKSTNVAVVSCPFNWQDIGSWESYQALYPANQQGNTILGEAILIDSKNNFIHSEGRMVASIGIQDLAIIDTPDALLITHRHRSQDVKQIVQTLKEQAHESYLTHKTVIRPWGSYTVLEEGPSFKIKRIVVHPKASLSLQLHQQRSEHWVVVEGIAQVINGECTYLLNKNESTFVPMGVPHRLSNPGKTDLIIIEVQTGSYLGEDDIIRLEDSYGRK